MTAPTRNGDDGTASASPLRVLAISGSLRAGSYSTAILTALAAAAAPRIVFDFTDIGELPHFDQDLYVEPLPESVRRLRDLMYRADGLVISSPEYNHGVPGVLKNALDWASRPHNGSPLRGKPVLIVTSSLAFTGGVRAQYQIRETVVSALARPVATPEIVVGMVGSKMRDGRFEDDTTMAFAMAGLETMIADIELVRHGTIHLLPADHA